MRLLYVIGSLGPGGAETSLAAMAPGLVARGLELHVLNLGVPDHLAPELRQAGAIVHQDVARRRTRPGNLGQTLRTANRVKPHLIHTTLYEADVAGRAAAGILRLPASSSFVGDSYSPAHYAQHGRLKVHISRSLDALTAHAAHYFHANSEALADTVPARLGIARDRVVVIPRGRSPQRFQLRTPLKRRLARARLGLDQSEPVVLSVGRLEPVKGLDTLLYAASRATAGDGSLTVLLAGKEGSATARLKAVADSLPLKIRFLGHRTDIPDLLAAADALCLPSLREGFPGAALEAMAVGCPVIASDIPAIREVLGPEYPEHLFVPVGDVPAWAATIRQVMGSLETLDDVSHTSRRRFEQNFTIDRIVERMADFFQMVAS